MKIQDLAIIFVIIIIPISLVLSIYTQFQMQTINMQTLYDTKLTSATYDAIKAFQLNSANSTTSDLSNSKIRDLEASVTTFRNSLKSAFELNGYTEEELNNYIPALVYTLYDGFYIYSPYENVNRRYEIEKDEQGNEEKNPYTDEPVYVEDASGNKIPIDENGETLYGLKPYINYSCRYIKNDINDIDVVITYALDNFITVQGKIGDGYVNKSGYLIEGIEVKGDGSVTYNEITIEKEHLKENIAGKLYSYAKINGTKYYLMENVDVDGDGDIEEGEGQIIYFLNGIPKVQYKTGNPNYDSLKKFIQNNDSAQQYYKDAYEFTKWFKDMGLSSLQYKDACDEVIDDKGNVKIEQIWKDNERLIFAELQDGILKNIENETSNFNEHRLAIIRHKIEVNLAIAIANYNNYSGATNEFQMPELKEDEWDYITHNISLMSFLQGLPIGGKTYNGYTLVTNSESKEVVLEQNIYILGKDKKYHRIGDKGLEGEGTIDDAGDYGLSRSAGRLNLDFKRTSITDDTGVTNYYYPLKEYNASYDSIVMQNKVTTYDDIYEYVEKYDALKEAFYTALGRERYGGYKTVITNIDGIIKNAENKEDTDGVEIPDVPEISETYTLLYNANGGTGTTDSQTINVNENITLKPKDTFVAPSGTHFKGWSTDSSGSGTIYEASSTQVFNDNTTLYAIWEVHTYACYSHVHDLYCWTPCEGCGFYGYHGGAWAGRCSGYRGEFVCEEEENLTCGGTK